MNYTLIEDNLLSNNQCQSIINYYKNLTTKVPDNFSYVGYNYLDINQQSKYYRDLIQASNILYNNYISKFTQIKYLNKHILRHFVFKHFEPGKNFDRWHCEHHIEYPNRVLNITFYLSNHNAGTEFYDGSIIKSVAGRGVLTPCSFTHTHKGQQCDMNLDRYIITGYFNYE